MGVYMQYLVFVQYQRIDEAFDDGSENARCRLCSYESAIVSNACVCMYVFVCVTTAGVVSTVAGSTVSGSVDGVGTVAKFYGPRGISVDSTGNVWILDTDNHMIRQINTAGSVCSIVCRIWL